MDWGSIASAGGTVINGMMGYIANERTNEQNAELTRENREWQTRMYQLQLSDQERLYNKYNSPEAMRRQYELAGLNPNLMMKNGAQGQANINSSVPSSSPIPMQAYQPNMDFSSLQGIGLRSAQIDNIQASTDAQLLENRFKLFEKNMNWREQLSRIDKNSQEAKHLRRMIREADIEINYMDDFLNSRNDSQREQANVNRENARLIGLQADCQEIVNNYQSSLSQATLRKINAEAAAAYASVILSRSQSRYYNESALSEVTKRVYMRLESDGVRLSNEEKRITNSYLDEMMQLDLSSSNQHYKQQLQDYWNPFRYAGQVLGGAAAGSVAAGMRNSGARTVVKGFVP